jgi:hypothetical protein
MTKFPRALERALFERDKETCQICGRPTEFGDGEIDHIIPKSKDGGDEPENLQWACHRCNKLKSNKRTNEQVRKILSLPEDFEEIMKFRSETKAEKETPVATQFELPTLSCKGLDVPAVEKCIQSLQESYQSETIIDEVCNRITAVDEITAEFVHLGFHTRFPRLWFLPYEITHQSFFNEVLFSDLGREIAIGERYFFEKSILDNKEISRIGTDFSSSGISRAVDEMESRGLKPNLIALPLRFWGDLHQWSGDAQVEYGNEERAKLKATLKTKEKELRIIDPLGEFPKEPMLLSQNAVEWVVKRNAEGALYVVFGNHQLYPLKYVELLTGITIKSVVHPEEIAILDFGQ